MTPLFPTQSLAPTATDLDALRRHWGWFLVMGIALVALGTFAISWACLATVTLAATWLFGWMLFIAGAAEIVSAFRVGRWGGTLVHLLLGVLYMLVGLLVVDEPGRSAIQLTLVIAIFLIVSGAFRIVFALTQQFSGGGWVLLNGIVTLVLGVMIYKQWPYSGLWVIGLFVGIDMLLGGWRWIILSLMLRSGRPEEGGRAGVAMGA